MDTNTKYYNRFYDTLARAIRADEDFASVLAWCEGWVDAEVDTTKVSPDEAARDAVRAYRNSQGSEPAGPRYPARSFRLPPVTQAQLDFLCRAQGYTQVQALVLAVDRLAREFGWQPAAPAEEKEARDVL